MNVLDAQFAAVVQELTANRPMDLERGDRLRSEALQLLADGAGDTILPTGDTCLFHLLRGLTKSPANMAVIREVI